MSKRNETIDFIGIGFPKSATSWVAEVLKTHPDIYIPSQKELWFFLTENINNFGVMPNNHNKNLEWYLRQFKNARTDQLLGEFTPTYIYDLNGLLKLKAAFPDVKLIIVIRNPIELIYSQYYYMKSSVADRISFSLNDIFTSPFGQSLLNYGKIGTHLRNVFKIFSRDKIFVRALDQVKENKELFFQDLCSFLKVDSKQIQTKMINKKSNEARRIRFNSLHELIQHAYIIIKNYNIPIPFSVPLFYLYNRINRPTAKNPIISEKLRYKLQEYYHEEIEQVEEMLNIKLTNWKMIKQSINND